MANLLRPRTRLDDVNPVVSVESEIDLAFAELAWIDSKIRSTNTCLNIELDKIRKAYSKHEYVDTDAAEGEKLVERKSKLLAALVAYAKAAKDKLLEGLGKLKTRTFALGTIAFKQQTEKLMPAGDLSLDDCLRQVLDQYELPALLERWLNEYSAAGQRLGDVLRIDFAWNAASIKDLAEKRKISPEQLAELGLKIDRDDEKVEVKLKS